MSAIKVKMELAKLSTVLDTTAVLVSDAMLQDALKNVSFWVQSSGDNVTTHLVVYNVSTVTYTQLDAQVEGLESGVDLNFFVQLNARNFIELLGTLKGLKRTRVTDITMLLTLQGSKVVEAKLVAVEEALTEADAELYNQQISYNLPLVLMQENVRQPIVDGHKAFQEKSTVAAERVSGVVFRQYLQALTGLLVDVQKDKRDNRINFRDSRVYVIPYRLLAVFKSGLPTAVTDFTLTSTVAKYLSNFLTDVEEFDLALEKSDRAIKLYISYGDTRVLIQTSDATSAVDSTPYEPKPDNAIALDRLYFLDILRRMAIGNNETIDISISLDEQKMTVASKAAKQNVQVLKARGSGAYSLVMRIDLLRGLTLAHYNAGGLLLSIYIVPNGNTATLYFGDETKQWFTVVSDVKLTSVSALS